MVSFMLALAASDFDVGISASNFPGCHRQFTTSAGCLATSDNAQNLFRSGPTLALFAALAALISGKQNRCSSGILKLCPVQEASSVTMPV